MNVSDLTDEDIGRTMWVKGTTNPNWMRVCFEGLTSRHLEKSEHERQGGSPYWMILMATPQPGLLHFKTPSGQTFTGLLVRSTAEVWPVEVDLAVSEHGEIVELGERTA